MTQHDDAKIFGRVAKELSAGQRDEDLWAKAFALANGDENATRASYIRMRVEQLTDTEPSGATSSGTARKSPRILPAPAMPGKDVPSTDARSASAWARFWARMIDLAICVLIAEWLMSVLGVSASIQSPIARAFAGFAFGGAFLVIYDTFLLAHFGATAGKGALGVTVRNEDGGLLQIGPSLKRALSVWFFGSWMNAGFPALPAIAWWSAYKSLRTEGTTSWDRAGGFEVHQAKPSAIRTTIGVSLGVLCLVFLSLGTVLGKRQLKDEWRVKSGSSESEVRNIASSAASQHTLTAEEFLDAAVPPSGTVDWSQFTPVGIVDIPSGAGVSVSIAGLGNDGYIVGTVSNASHDWQVTNVDIVLTDSQQYVDFLSGKRSAPAYSETYRSSVLVAPVSTEVLRVPARWDYERGFLLSAIAKGVRNSGDTAR